MTAGVVRWPSGLNAELVRHADAGRPAEVCGFLLGRAVSGGVDVRRVLAATNAWEPETERDRRYAFDPREQVAAERAARGEELDVVGYYHSHPAAAPVPSGVDLALAWPAYTYIIVGFVGHSWSMRAWALDNQGRAFIEQQIVPAE